MIAIMYRSSKCNETDTELLILVGPYGGVGVTATLEWIPDLLSLGSQVTVKLDRDTCVELVGSRISCEGNTTFISV